MLSLLRKHISQDTESRVFPRIEFHYPITIIGIDDRAKIIDFSLNGFYVETRKIAHLAMGQKINLALKLPEERQGVVIKAEVVHLDAEGFGCKFWNLASGVAEALERSFDLYAGMLPLE